MMLSFIESFGRSISDKNALNELVDKAGLRTKDSL
jgi:hypothetical protein